MSRELKLATAESRQSATWKNTITDWDTLLEQLAEPHIGTDTTEQYHKATKAKQADFKDVGGFVGGHLAQGRRRKGHVLSRSLLTLDLDTPPVGLLDRLPLLLDVEWAVYSTHSHLPDAPRLRLVLPLGRDVTEDEYPALGRRVAADVGIDYFDDTTYEPHRMMYAPSRPSDGQFLFRHHDGTWLNPDKQLARYDNWRDVSTWPTSSRQSMAIASKAESQADPLDKPGLVGAFCRAHDIDDAIAMLGEQVYTEAGQGRYTYVPGESVAGVVTYDGKFAYSWHGTDPAGEQLCNAFDLVRIHRFGHEDDEVLADKPQTPTNKLPSFKLMTTFASEDEATRKVLAAERTERSAESEFDVIDSDAVLDDDAWQTKLELTKKGTVEESLSNFVTILTHDPKLQAIAFNELASAIDVLPDGKLPWKRTKPAWTDTDLAQLKVYIEHAYGGLYSPTKTKEALVAVAANRAYHPVRDYLRRLPSWDGAERVDRLLVDYLGADDNAYTRAVTRKTLVAAIARVMHPGIKFDQVLILNGPQGVGKSTIFARLGGDWFSDALTMTDMKDKTGAEKMQGNWILEIGELSGMRKMEVEVVKSFISRTDDKYRPAYASVVESHPRQCIIVGTTNAEDGFLRDITGNRRFWPVAVTGVGEKKSWEITPAVIDQVWAEALTYYRAKEPLHLTGEIAELAKSQQDSAIESDDRVGLVADYLAKRLPPNWDEMPLHQRRAYITGAGGEFGPVDFTVGVERDQVTHPEIWAECFGNEPAALQRRDSYEIASIMKQVPGWERTDTQSRVPLYGKQRLYKRVRDRSDDTKKLGRHAHSRAGGDSPENSNTATLPTPERNRNKRWNKLVPR